MDYPWYAVKVRTGAELRLAAALQRKDYHIFLPTWAESRRYSDRMKKVQAPLFPGYLFSRFDIDLRLPLITTPGVESIVSTAGVPTPIEQSEIDAIIKIVESGASAEPWPYLKSGDRVRIQFGSLTGVEGVLVNNRGKDRLVISIHLLQRSISVEIDRTWVRPVDLKPHNP